MHDPYALSFNCTSGNNANSAGLWRDHPATPAQRALGFTRASKHPTQAELLIGMLRRARSEARALELPEIMAAGIAQHGARFNEIRSRGFVVENERLRDPSGRILSRYFLRFDPEAEAQ